MRGRGPIIKPVPTATRSVALTGDKILAALRDCYHPELGENIVDLGVVEGITLAPDPAAPGAGIPGVPHRQRIRIDLMPPPTANEATNAQIAAIVRNRLAAFETVTSTEVVLLDQPRWTPERITPDARARISQQTAATKHGLIQIK
jgi:metal-sulfur cluster biosynthetic enzyme